MGYRDMIEKCCGFCIASRVATVDSGTAKLGRDAMQKTRERQRKVPVFREVIELLDRMTHGAFARGLMIFTGAPAERGGCAAPLVGQQDSAHNPCAFCLRFMPYYLVCRHGFPSRH